MKRKNMTRNALVTSIISLLLCVSMLVGTTFAWFTDEVTSGRNTIAAGNLDIELLIDGDENKKVTKDTVLFDTEYKWEPGMVVYEDLQIANVGTLALKYQLTLDVLDENNLNGHKLSEVVKIAVLDKPVAEIVDPAKPAAEQRAAVMAAAKASVATTNGQGTLNNFFLQGSLPAGEKTPVVGIVIFWEPNDNETDNLYNANNGQVTSDGKPLYIEFGVNLQATQLMHEKDSFGDNYDEFASFLPYATLNATGPDTITATTTFPNGTDPMPYDVPFMMQFQPNETYEAAQSSVYRYYHADFVVTADRDVPGNSMALFGYYKAACDSFNNGNWVAMTTPDTIPAGTPVRLVEALGVPVNYEEICLFGNDGTGFLCSAMDLTGVNAGTTLTVELRLYETTGDPTTDDGPKNIETGESFVVRTINYTFPAAKVSTVADMKDAFEAGTSTFELAAGEHKMPSSSASGTLEIIGTKDTVIDMTAGAYLDNATVIIDGATIKTSTGYVIGENGQQGSDYAALYTPNATYKNCTFVGPMRVGRDGAKFINCTFTNLGNDYIWTYGNDVTFEGCTFNTDGKAILVYSDGGNEVAQVSVKNCTFNATQGAKAGAIANQNCAAIEIQNYGNGVNLTAEGNTFDANFSGEWRIKTYHEGRPQVVINGTEYTTIAIDGHSMTIDANNNVTVN